MNIANKSTIEPYIYRIHGKQIAGALQLLANANQPARPTAIRGQADELLKPKDIMQHCRISRTTLWRWENVLGLKTINVGFTKLFRSSDLEAFLQRHTTNGENKLN